MKSFNPLSRNILFCKEPRIEIPDGWRRLRLGETVPEIHKYQNGNKWCDGVKYPKRKQNIRVNMGFIRYIIPIEEKQTINYLNPS